jgi:hypothetical protein
MKNLITREDSSEPKRMFTPFPAQDTDPGHQELKAASGTCSQRDCGTNWMKDLTPA